MWWSLILPVLFLVVTRFRNGSRFEHLGVDYRILLEKKDVWSVPDPGGSARSTWAFSQYPCIHVSLVVA
jgi:hypothetical protein